MTMSEYELLRAIWMTLVVILIVVSVFMVFFLERGKRQKDLNPGTELVRWAKEHDHLPREIKVRHDLEYHNNPASGDYSEGWWIEEKKGIL